MTCTKAPFEHGFLIDVVAMVPVDQRTLILGRGEALNTWFGQNKHGAFING